DRGGDDRVLVEAHAVEEAAVGDTGRREQHVAGGHLFDEIFPVGIGDAHAAGALALFVGIEDQPALHEAADAAERRGRQHALGRTARTHVDVDAGFFGVGRVDDAGNVAVADELQRYAR